MKKVEKADQEEKRNTNSVDRRIRRTKKLLKESLATLLLQKKLNDITVKELVELADLNRGTFYLHYRDIYEMLTQIEAEMLNELQEISDRYAPDVLRVSPKPYITEVFHYVADNQTFCKMLLGPYGDIGFVEKLKKMVEEKCFRLLIETCPQKALPDYEFFAAYTVSGSIGLLQRWMESGMKVSPEELAEVAEGMIQNGMEYLLRNTQNTQTPPQKKPLARK